MDPRTRTTTETVSWKWPCGTACKMERQVTISCPHGCRCWHAMAPSTGHHHHHSHHPYHHHQEGTRALAAEEQSNSGRRTLNLAAQQEGTRALAAEEASNSGQRTLNLAAPVVAAAEFWVPDPYLMVQQLREFESLYDEAVPLRVQLEEYTGEIEKSKKDNDWFLALPENIRKVLVMARDAINSYIAVSTPPAK